MMMMHDAYIYGQIEAGIYISYSFITAEGEGSSGGIDEKEMQ